MKKSIFLLVLFFSSFNFFAQESQEITQSGEFIALEDSSNNSSKNIAIGFYQTDAWALGNFADYFSCKIGGGLNVDYVIPLKNNYSLAPSFDFELGRLINNKNVQNIFSSSFYWTTKIGLNLNVPLYVKGAHDFYCSAKLSYGLFVQNIATRQNTNTLPKKSYIDQIISLNTIWSYVPTNLLQGKLQFNLTQEFSIVPTKNEMITFLGIAFGVQYKF